MCRPSSHRAHKIEPPPHELLPPQIQRLFCHSLPCVPLKYSLDVVLRSADSKIFALRALAWSIGFLLKKKDTLSKKKLSSLHQKSTGRFIILMYDLKSNSALAAVSSAIFLPSESESLPARNSMAVFLAGGSSL